jgi:hypothetical protein
MLAQGHKAWLSDWFILLHELLNDVDRWKQDAIETYNDEYLSTCLTASWNKIERYYKGVDKTPVYYAAIILNPTLKLHKLRDLWQTKETEPWVSLVEEKVRAIWRAHYKPPYYARTQRSNDDDDGSAYARYSSAKRLRLDAPSERLDSFEAYLSIDPEPYDKHDSGEAFDVIAWWLQRRYTYPGLAQFAFDVFSTPLMSDDNERSFSSGRDMITYRRTKLQSDVIEACQCLKSWIGPPKDAKEPVFDDDEVIEKDIKGPEP